MCQSKCSQIHCQEEECQFLSKLNISLDDIKPGQPNVVILTFLLQSKHKKVKALKTDLPTLDRGLSKSLHFAGASVTLHF